MSVDYRKFKTPFFEISVGDSSGQNMISLPHHILRLVSKVEIVETWQTNSFNTVNITFLEGSREPASSDASKGTEGLYKIASYETRKVDVDVAGSLTNRTGIITDLRFSGSSGITFTTAREKRQNAIDTSKQKNVINNTTTRAFQNEPSRPKFLFQERNQISLTWGYKEDPDTIRTIRTYIMLVSVKYPESGQIETTLSCQDTTAALDQITTSKGKSFGKRFSTGTGNFLAEFEDETTDEMIRKICESAGISCVVSKNLPTPTLDKDHQKVWLAGESFSQFMWKLAEQNNAVFKVVPDDKGVDKLYFVKKSEFEKKILVNRQFLNYKNPGSILKSLDLKVDFGVPANASVNGNTTEGTNKTYTNEDPGQVLDVAMFEGPEGKKEERVNFDPCNPSNSISSVKGIQEKVSGGSCTGKHVITPDANEKNRDVHAAWIQEGQARIIQLEFNTLGYTKLTPGTVDIAGLGVRYSGKYRVITATHTINSEGYTTKCSATSMSVGAGGLVSPSTKFEKDKEKEQAKVQLYKSSDRDENNSNAIQKELETIR